MIRSNPAQNSIVYLKDVARVQLGKVSYSSNSFVDGKRASYLLVYQAPGSNALATAQGVYNALADAKKYFPADVNYSVPFESVSVVKVSIDDVVTTLLIALLLAPLAASAAPGDDRSVPLPAELAVDVDPGAGHSGGYYRNLYILYPTELYDQYADDVWFCAGHRHRGG